MCDSIMTSAVHNNSPTLHILSLHTFLTSYASRPPNSAQSLGDRNSSSLLVFLVNAAIECNRTISRGDPHFESEHRNNSPHKPPHVEHRSAFIIIATTNGELSHHHHHPHPPIPSKGGATTGRPIAQKPALHKPHDLAISTIKKDRNAQSTACAVHSRDARFYCATSLNYHVLSLSDSRIFGAL